MRDLSLDDDISAPETSFHVAVSAPAGEVEISGHDFMHERRAARHRVLESDHSGQRIDLRLDQLDCVGGGVPVLGDDRSDHLADEAHAIDGEDRSRR